MRSPARVDVRALRRRMRLTQCEFANRFGFGLATLRHWEQGRRHPAGTALVLLEIISVNPRLAWQAAKRVRDRIPGALPALRHPKTWRAPPGMAVPVY